MRNSMLKRRITRMAIPACAAFLMIGGLTSCEDDLLTGQPSYLGQSIYDELARRGNFTETLKLINAQDEDYASVLKKTGSKTMFVADDAAWQKFYQNNPWGVTSLEDMSDAQKKLVFKANIINSAYLVELLGNIPAADANSDSQEGACMRRVSSVNLMDSVPVVPASQFPVINPIRQDSKTGAQIDYWSHLRGKSSALILQDDQVATMIHFMPKFMQNNNITSEDVEFMTNGEITSNTGAFVNGKVIRENDGNSLDEMNQDITCQNGYIHILEGVALPLDNMANVISNQPQFSIYSRLLDRFSYPEYSASLTAEYQRQYGGNDSVYVKRYFNTHKSHSTENDYYNNPVSSKLPYDPGWNRYSLYSAGGNLTFQHNAAAMLVPTDAAMIAYLQSADGEDLNKRFANAGPGATAWDNAPDAVILPLLNNTMLSSLKASIPSQFAGINNTAGERMGVDKADISKTLWACNGVIYQTDKVYLAPEYVSVYYPCVVRANDDMKYVYYFVNRDSELAGGEGFYAYLNNMGNKNNPNNPERYSFIIPTDNALQTYYDPVTYKKVDAYNRPAALAYRFYMNDAKYVSAYPHRVDWETLDGDGRGTISDQVSTDVSLSASGSPNRSEDVFNHFADILNSSLCTSTFRPGRKFYQARNGAPIIVQWGTDDKVKGVAGSFQYERGYFIPVTESFDKSSDGNGISYVVDQEPIMSSFASPDSIIESASRTADFGTFASLLKSMNSVKDNVYSGHATMDRAITSLDNYHYTIYVPTNASIERYYYENLQMGDTLMLPNWDIVSDVTSCLQVMDPISEEDDYNFLLDQLQFMKDVISNFVNYHIQDNSVFLEGAEYDSEHGKFESACLDTTTTRFVRLEVNYSLSDPLNMTVKDNSGNVRKVVTDNNNYNILSRQYLFNGDSQSSSSRIYSSAFAVIHQIDAPLLPFKVDAKHPYGSLYPLSKYQRVQTILAAHPLIASNPIKRKR